MKAELCSAEGTVQELAPGQVVDARYVVEAELGRGGISTVYRVRHATLQSVHALKVPREPSVEAHARLLREGRAQGALHHPNVLRATDVVRIGDAPGLVLEHVDGPTLDAALRDGRVSGWAARDAIGRGILRGVRAAHAAGWVHRDLKPSNVLLAWADGAFVPKVSDFGLARAVEDASLTRTGGVVGSPAYMSPEQLAGAAADPRADVFALGALLYELATSRRAFEGNAYESAGAIRAGRFVPPRAHAPALPARMERAIVGALVADPERRIRDCDRLLAVWSGDDGRPASRVPWVAAGAVVATVALAVWAGSRAPLPVAVPAARPVAEAPAVAPAPADRVEATAGPGPTPAPRRKPTGRVEATGAEVELVADGRAVPPGVVPTGAYEVRARFGDKTQSFGTIDVRPDATVHVVCDPRFSRCRIESR